MSFWWIVSALKCRLFGRHQLSAYLDSELSPGERTRFQHHFDRCPYCRHLEEEFSFAQRVLGKIEIPAIQPVMLPVWLQTIGVDKKELAFSLPWIPVAAATLVCVAVVSGLWLRFRTINPVPSFKVGVTRLSGTPEINAIPFQRPVLLQKGEQLSTDAWSTALIEFGKFGQIETAVNTEVALLESDMGHQRLSLKRGKLYASLSAPPRMFLINTPAGTAVDMGCAYSLEVNDEGETLLKVVSGWVALNLDSREELVPAGTTCRSRPGKGPGTPFVADARPELQNALNNFDFAGAGSSALDTIIKQARQKDAITLWYLLRKVQGEQRVALYEALNSLVPAPQTVSRAGILDLNEKMLQAWREPIDYASLGFDPKTIQFDRGTLRPTGGLNEVRFGHTATLLSNGKLLVAGGFTTYALNTAELFDPAAEGFAYTGSMQTQRVGHTATRLLDGTVLITGGSRDPFEGGESTAELYDPATGTFRFTGKMRYPRLGHAATLLNDGRVLITGGIIKDGYSNPAAEIYDPSTGIFSEAGKPNVPRFDHTATLMNNGEVLIAGGGRAVGLNEPIEILKQAEIFDPGNQSFRLVGTMSVGRHKHSATLLPNGNVLIIGGSDGHLWGGTIASAEVFNQATGSFSKTGQMSTSRYKIRDAVVALSNGKILIAGGGERLEIYEPGSGIFTPVPGSIGAARYMSSATLLNNGSVIIVGGYTAPPDKTGIRLLADAGAWIYTP